MAKTNIVGIDLGTTYSAIARLDAYGQPIAIANSEGEFSTPSVVYFSDSGPIVGTAALQNIVVHADRVVSHAKRELGNKQAGWTIGGKRYSPVDISALVLEKLKTDAEEQIGPISQAVITVPAHFDAYRRQLTIEAAKQAGLKVLDLVNEPVAAALCYILGEEGMVFRELAQEQQILVYDLGGGTFDLSLVQYDPENVRVMATNGDLKLGGLDWNQRILRQVLVEHQKKFEEDLSLHPRLLQKIGLEIEQAKRTLSNPKQDSVTLNIQGVSNTWDRTLYRDEFESMTTDLVQRTRGITERLLEHNRLGWAHVDTILSVGGSTRMPMIRRMLKSLAGVTPNYSLSPDLSVAHGAALYAGIVLGKRGEAGSRVNEKLGKIETTNVNAHSLGIIVRNSHNRRVNHIVIPRNTALPASAHCTVGTTRPGQHRIRLQIVEGEGSGEEDNETLCSCIIDDLPADLPENSEVTVSLTYEKNGLLTVTAEHRESGLLASVNLKRDKGLAGKAESTSNEENPAKTTSNGLSPEHVSALMESSDPKQRIEAVETAYRHWMVELFPQVDELARFDLDAKVRDKANEMIAAVRKGQQPSN